MLKIKSYLKNLFDRENSIKNRIAKNEQKIRLVKLHTIGLSEKIHIEHLETENRKLREMLVFTNSC